jgi:hypothetical protein
MKTKAEITQEALSRIEKLEKGQPVTNICAGESNPTRLSFFQGLIVKTRKNKFGMPITERWARCSNKKGSSWNTGVEMIYPGHIDYSECQKLFKPIHAVFFPQKPQNPATDCPGNNAFNGLDGV